MCCLKKSTKFDANANFRYYLVQYARGDNLIIHAVVHRTEISWPMGELAVQQKVLIRDGRYQRIATVLYMDEAQYRVLYQLKCLKANCYQEHSVAAQQVHPKQRSKRSYVRQDNWLLVQYSKTTASVAYEIVEDTAAVWSDSRNKDIFVYITNGGITKRAIVLEKSHKRRELIYKLRNIRLHCLERLHFPLTNSFHTVAERTYNHRTMLQKVSKSVGRLNRIDEQDFAKCERSFYVVQFLRISYKIIMDRLNLKILRELDLLTLTPSTMV